jgi:hypothetical protein
LPALPLLLVASVVVVERARLGAVEACAALALGGYFAHRLAMTSNDESLRKRLLILVLPLAVSLLATAACAWTKRVPGLAWTRRVLVAACIATGVGIGLGHDLHAHGVVKKACDDYVDAVAHLVPQRFALVGALGEIDDVLALAATRDIEYADTLRVAGFAELRPLFEYWRDAGRPTFIIALKEPVSPWKDVAFVNATWFLYRVEFLGGPREAP